MALIDPIPLAIIGAALWLSDFDRASWRLVGLAVLAAALIVTLSQG